MALGTNGVDSYTSSVTLPSFTARNGIALFAQDSGSSTAPVATYRYKLFGTAPYRKLVYDVTGNRTYYNTASVRYTAQAVLYETTGRVEVVCNPCTQETTRSGTQGVTNAAGTVSAFLTGRNNAAFSATDTAVFDTLAGQTCAAPTNNDGVKNGAESGIDCGGSSGKLCGYLAPASALTNCSAGSDCQSGVCSSNKCSISAVAQACWGGADCSSGSCSTSGTPTSLTTAGTCSAVGNGSACQVSGDCLSATCTANVCAGAADGAACANNGQCQSNLCLAGGTCAKQSGVACGGDAECASAFCLSTTGTKVVSYAGSLAVAPTGTWTNVFAGSSDDSRSSSQTMPFSIQFYGDTVDRFIVNPNGALNLGSAASTPSTAGASSSTNFTSSSTPNRVLAFWWGGDLAAGTGGYRWQTVGAAGSRRHVLQFSAYHYGAPSNLVKGEVVFHEAASRNRVVDIFCENCGFNGFTYRQGAENALGNARFGLGTRASTGVTSGPGPVNELVRLQTVAAPAAVCF
jgi:hypothetical protein